MEGAIINVKYQGMTCPFEVVKDVNSGSIYVFQIQSRVGYVDKKYNCKELVNVFTNTNEGINDDKNIKSFKEIDTWTIKADEEVVVYAWKFRFQFIYKGPTIEFTGPAEFLREMIPAIVDAYIDARWQRGVTRDASNVLFDLREFVSKHITAKKQVVSKSEPKEEPKAEPTGYKYKDLLVKIGSILPRATKLENTWQVSVIPLSKAKAICFQSTINFAEDKLTSHDSSTTTCQLKCGDLIKVEIKNLQLEIFMLNAFTIPNRQEWLLHNIAPLVKELCMYEAKHLPFESNNNLNLLTLSHYGNKAIKARNEYLAQKTKSSVPAPMPTTKPKQNTYLMGMARKSSVYGINTVRFGSSVSKCRLDIIIPTMSLSTIDLKKLKAYKVVRLVANSAKPRVEIRELEAIFGRNDWGLCVQVDALMTEYYITYDSVIVDQYPNGIEFEFLKSNETATTFD
ncbi:hypothetical protein E24_00400 [Faustovirus]|nr:hypothetical protein PRJ_Fausto_00377 [Faustovirus]AMN83316.1 hypothetical protein E24_00400 [Faustovirus]AMN84299.1 hypothetical protein D5a_00399 [Faustovirus]AMN85287.1 hypothetical protein E23_00400 [Faustovirus]QBR99284.1 hypothetical protein [Faustovirus mariensis]